MELGGKYIALLRVNVLYTDLARHRAYSVEWHESHCNVGGAEHPECQTKGAPHDEP